MQKSQLRFEFSFDLDVRDDQRIITNASGDRGHCEMKLVGLFGSLASDFLQKDMDLVVAGRNVVDLEVMVGVDFAKVLGAACDGEGAGVDEVVGGDQSRRENKFACDRSTDTAEGDGGGLAGGGLSDSDVFAENHGR